MTRHTVTIISEDKVPCSVVALVHAKGQSSRCPGKNLRTLGDRPLIGHAIEAARQAAFVDEVVIDSDSREILDAGEWYGATPLQRPAELATNATNGHQLAAWQASQRPESEVIVQVVPTCPFTRPSTIDRAILAIRETGKNTAAGVFSEPFYLWKDRHARNGSLPNSQDLAAVIYETTGLYAAKTSYVLEHGKRMDLRSCAPIEVSRLEAVNIDTKEDFRFAEWLWEGRLACDSRPRSA